MTDFARRCADQIPSVCARRGLPPPVDVQPLPGGSANLNFVARFGAYTGAAPVKVTFCLYKDLPGARRVAVLLAALDDAPVGRLIGTPDDVTEEAGRAALVTAFTEGAPLETIDRPTARAIGALLAAIHRSPPLEAPSHDMERVRLARIAEAGGAGDFTRFVADAMADVPLDGHLPTALIHGDLFPDNIIRGPDGRLTAIDFEEASRGPRAFDLGMALVGFSRCDALTPENAAALLAGYRAAVPLEPRELEALPAMVIHAAVATAAWRHIGTPDEIEAGAREWREMRAIVALARRWRDGTWDRVADRL